MKNNYPAIAIFIITLLSSVFYLSNSLKLHLKPAITSTPASTFASPAPLPSANQILGARVKTAGCQAQGPLPDKACTPGAVMAGVTKEQICTSGYSSSVRNVTSATKDQVFAEYGITSHQPGQYEIDHLISLELAGSNDVSNLWPEPAEPRPGYHEKDRYENFLHQQICSGKITLEEAQKRISDNWLKNWVEAGQP